MTKIVSQPHIIIVGDPVTGFAFIGPFTNHGEAVKFGNTYIFDPNWWVASIYTPMEIEDDPEVEDQANIDQMMEAEDNPGWPVSEHSDMCPAKFGFVCECRAGAGASDSANEED